MTANAAALAEDAKAAARGAADAAAKLAGDAQRSVAEASQRFEGVVEAGLGQLRAQSRAYADTASQQLEEAQRYLTNRGRERPLAATGAAIGVGVLIGLLMATGRRH